MITDDDLRNGLRGIAAWGTPAAVPPIPDAPVSDLDLERRGRPRPTWWAAAAVLVAMAVAVATLGGSSTPPIARGSWKPIAPAPIEPRALPASVWTGTEVIVVGGQSGRGEFLRDAAAYNPRTDTWRRLPDAPADVHPGATALWTGTEVVVFDTQLVSVAETRDGFFETQLAPPSVFDPATETWRPLTVLPHFIEAATVVGGRIIALAADDDSKPVILQLEGNGWQTVARPAAPGFDYHMIRNWTAFASGGRAVFMAGEWTEIHIDADTPIGFTFDPVTRVTGEVIQPPLRAPGKSTTIPQLQAAASAAGTALVVGSTNDGDNRSVYDAAVLDTASQQWHSVDPPDELPLDEDMFRGLTFTTVGDDVVVLGGAPSGSTIGDGKGGLRVAFTGRDSRWHDLPESPIDLHRVGHTAVWTGTELVVWGGLFNRGGAGNRGDTPAPDGARYSL